MPRRFAACPPARVWAVLALVGTTALWGTSFVAAKAVLPDVPPVVLAFLRFVLAAAVLVPLACRGGGRPARGPRPALLGLTGVALFFLCQNAGLSQTSAANATLILGGGLPALTALFGVGFLGERLSRRQLGGLSCSLVGVAAVVLAGGRGGIEFSLLGDGLLVVAAGSGASYAVLGRRSFGRDLVGTLAGSTLYGLLFLAPPAVAELVVVGADWPSTRRLLLLIHLGIGCSTLAFVLWAYSLRHLTAVQNAVIGNLELPIGLGVAALLLGEALAPGHLVGGGVILGGAWLAAEPVGFEPVPAAA